MGEPTFPYILVPATGRIKTGAIQFGEQRYDEESQPDPDAQRREELRKRTLELQGEYARSKVRDFLAMYVPALCTKLIKTQKKMQWAT